ncbi:unnamed protein product [Urochloa humidicola]
MEHGGRSPSPTGGETEEAVAALSSPTDMVDVAMATQSQRECRRSDTSRLGHVSFYHNPTLGAQCGHGDGSRCKLIDTETPPSIQQKYLKFEESSGDPARVQVLYERAVSELPVSSDLWTGYTSYQDRSLKVPSVLRSVYYKATRNCTWVAELWPYGSIICYLGAHSFF